DLLEPGLPKALLVLLERERARDSSDLSASLFAIRRAQIVARHDVSDADTSSGPQDTVHLGEHARLVDGEADHAVGNDHVDGARGQRNVLDVALEELHIRRPGPIPLRDRQGGHLLSDVQAVDLPVGSPALAREAY